MEANKSLTSKPWSESQDVVGAPGKDLARANASNNVDTVKKTFMRLPFTTKKSAVTQSQILLIANPILAGTGMLLLATARSLHKALNETITNTFEKQVAQYVSIEDRNKIADIWQQKMEGIASRQAGLQDEIDSAQERLTNAEKGVYLDASQSNNRFKEECTRHILAQNNTEYSKLEQGEKNSLYAQLSSSDKEKLLDEFSKLPENEIANFKQAYFVNEAKYSLNEKKLTLKRNKDECALILERLSKLNDPRTLVKFFKKLESDPTKMQDIQASKDLAKGLSEQNRDICAKSFEEAHNMLESMEGNKKEELQKKFSELEKEVKRLQDASDFNSKNCILMTLSDDKYNFEDYKVDQLALTRMIGTGDTSASDKAQNFLLELKKQSE